MDPLGLWPSWGDIGNGLKAGWNGLNGALDTITLGGTKKMHEWTGTESWVDECSTAYHNGTTVGEIARDELIGMAAGAVTGGVGYVAYKGYKAVKTGMQIHKATKTADRAVDATRNAKKVEKSSKSAKAQQCGYRSFAADTLILMADGSKKPIEHVEVGDFVLATDARTGRQEAKEITDLWIHEDDLIELHTDHETVTTTEDHPFWSITYGQYVQADQLLLGDQLLTASGQPVTVLGLDYTSWHRPRLQPHSRRHTRLPRRRTRNTRPQLLLQQLRRHQQNSVRVEQEKTEQATQAGRLRQRTTRTA